MIDSFFTGSSNTIRLPKQYKWIPKEDISAYELALCIPVVTATYWHDAESYIEGLPESARRHFEEVK